MRTATSEASPGRTPDTTGSPPAGEPTRATVSPPGSPTPGRRPADAPQYYRGKEGRLLQVSSNYLKLEVEKDKGVFEYEVSYEPRVDNRNTRFRLLNQHRNVYGGEKVLGR